MTHIGDVRSLVLHPATTSHSHRSPDERDVLGVRPGTLRLSIGIEDVADLIADLARVLEPARQAVA
jgi:O-acetylhomoserine (thiol)-lyase